MPAIKLISTTKATTKDMFLDILFHQYPTFLVQYSTTWKEVTDKSSQCIISHANSVILALIGDSVKLDAL